MSLKCLEGLRYLMLPEVPGANTACTSARIKNAGIGPLAQWVIYHQSMLTFNYLT